MCHCKAEAFKHLFWRDAHQDLDRRGIYGTLKTPQSKTTTAASVHPLQANERGTSCSHVAAP